MYHLANENSELFDTGNSTVRMNEQPLLIEADRLYLNRRKLRWNGRIGIVLSV